MVIEAPVNSLDSARLQISLGAKAIYLGYKTERMNNMSLTGRGSYSVDGVKGNIESYEELKEIVTFAHGEGVQVYYTANVPSLAQPFEDIYVEHVRAGVEAGVDAVIAGDIAEILLIREHFDVDIVASTFFDTFNHAQIEFLEGLGVNMIVLPQHLKMEEIKKLCECAKSDLILFGNYGCSNNNGRCFLLHRLGENENIGIPCRSNYYVSQEGTDFGKAAFLDAGEDCTVCAIPELIKNGIKGLKIIDRCKPAEEVAPYIKVCIDAVECAESGEPIDTYTDRLFTYAPWWKNEFCDHSRCRYLSEESYKTYS